MSTQSKNIKITSEVGNDKATRKSQSDQEIAKQPGNHKVIGLNFYFASDWFGGWCKFFGPITE